MALVWHILGDCPGCGGSKSFGNIEVSGSVVLQGCEKCRYRHNVPLPPLRKKLLYLDQFFFSGAFRGGDARFLEAAERIADLTAKQVMVVPYSSIHEDETHQWEKKDDLFKFIKATSRGHEFVPQYDVERTQLVKAFVAYLADKSPNYLRDRKDILGESIDSWEGYLRIEVGRYLGDVDLIRSLKAAATTQLVDSFDGWRTSTATFDENKDAEHAIAGHNYMRFFMEFAARILNGDYNAVFDSPTISLVVQTLVMCVPKSVPETERITKVAEFLRSEHFRQIPYQNVSARLFATMKGMVRAGAYKNKGKALERLSGFFYDVKHIGTYAPYCDAIVVDRPMADLLSKPTARVEQTYGCKIFSLQNGAEFLDWLDELEAGITPEHKAGLELAYPR